MVNDLSARKKELLRRRLEGQGLRAATTAEAAAPVGVPADTAAGPRPDGSSLPMPAALRRLWFVGQRDPSDVSLNVGVAFRFDGLLDAVRLRAAVQAVVDRHEPLRFACAADETGAPVLRVRGEAPVPWTEHDLTCLADEAARRRLRVLVRRAQTEPFDLRAEPPIRAALAAFTDHHVLVLTVHHIAWDDESWRVLFDDLAAAYSGTPKPVPARSFTALDQTDPDRLAQSLEYWRRELAAPPGPLDLPAARRADRPNGHAIVTVELPGELLESVSALARAHGTTRFAVATAATMSLLHRCFGADDLLLAVPVTTRPAGAGDLIGYFGNSLLLRGKFAPGVTFEALIAAVAQRLAGGLEAAGAPIDQVVAAIGSTGEGLAGLVSASLSQRSGLTGLVLDGVAAADVPELAAVNGQLPLEFSLVGTGSGTLLELQYDADRFDETVAGGLARAWVDFLAAAVASPDVPMGGIALLTGAARAAAVAAGIGDDVEPGAQTLVDQFAAACAVRRDHAALVTDDESISYRELDARSNRLARALLARGVRPDDVVALVLPAGADFVIAALAVLKAGAAYLPVDPEYPADRIAFVIDDAAPALVLDAAAAADPAAGYDEAPLTDSDRGAPIRPETLAYVIYTSGSTGAPKGVGVEHRAISEHLRALASTGLVGEHDRLVQTSSVSFDASMFEIFSTLTRGAALVLPRPRSLTDIAYIASLLVREQVTVMHMVPSLLSTLLLIPEVKQWTTLATVPVGGEALPGEVADAFTTAFTAALSNNYGPTEAVVAATHFPVDRPQGGRVVPIGRPNAGVRAYVLDGSLAPVPTGVVGEIYLGGEQLARGYLGRSALTAERFVADPFVPGRRMYRTGDLARRGATGDLEFVGRADGQVKIRGHRIELGEIEAVLAAFPGVARAIVRVDRAPSGDRLLAYVIADGAEVDVQAVLAHARASLPGPLVPDVVIPIDEVPVTVHGKLDVDALPVPDAREQAFRAPSTATEKRVAAVFGELFGGPDGPTEIGADDSFFALGGHSLLAARLVTALSAEFGLPVDVRLPFDHPTVGGLAAAVAALARERLGVELDGPVAGDDDGWGDWADADFGGVVVNTDEAGSATAGSGTPPTAETPSPARPLLRDTVPRRPAPLAFSQLAMWFAHRFEGPSAAGHIPLTFVVDGPVEETVLAAALELVVARHPALRTGFTEYGGLPVQQVASAATVGLAVLDVDDAQTALSEAAEQAFDLARPPLLRARLLRAPDGTYLSLVFHHLVVDHASVELIVDDLITAYRGEASGSLAPLAPYEGPDYEAYASWQHELFGVDADPESAAGRYGREEIGYWRERLSGIPDEVLVATDRPRPEGLSRRAVIADAAVHPDVRRRLREVLDRGGVSEFMAVHAAFAATLQSVGAGDDLVIGTPAAGRDDPDTENLVGLVANMVALRTKLSPDLTLADALRVSRDAVLDAFAHQDTPIERLVEALNPRRTRARNPLFQSMIHFRDRTESGDGRELSANGAVRLTMRPMVMDTSFLDLNLIASVTGTGGLDLRLVGAADLYDEATVDALVQRLAAVLTEIADRPQARLEALALPALPATVGPDDHGEDPVRLAALLAGRVPSRVQARPATLAALPHTGVTHCPSVRSWVIDGPGAGAGLAETLCALAPGSHVIDNHTAGAEPAAVAAVPALGGEPRTPTERALVTILAELVDVEGLGVDDNFFAVGGDSILSIQWCARAAAAGIALDPAQVFDCYTIAELAEAVDAAAAAPESDGAAPAQAPEPVSAPMSASGLSADALGALGAAWEARG